MKKIILCMIAVLLAVSMLVACEPDPGESSQTTTTTNQENPGSEQPGGENGNGADEDGLEFPQLPIS